MWLNLNTVSLPSSNSSSIPNDSPEARQYSRLKRRLGFVDTALGFAVLLVLLLTGWTGELRDLAVRATHDSYVVALFLYLVFLAVITKVISLPLDIYGFRLEHRFHLSNQKVGSWIWDEIKGLLVGLVLGAVVAELIYWTIRSFPDHWWLIAWAVFIVLVVFFAQIAPVVLFPIFYKFQSLQDEELKNRLVRLSERAGTRVRGVYEWKLSEKSKKANAALTGLGNTRRIILADTLLQNYTHDEIEAVLAHELGHHVHRHIFKTLALNVITTLVGFWAANEVLRYFTYERHSFEYLADFANLPLLALVATALSLLLMPALNAFSRFNERQADLYCWKSVPDVQPFITAMSKLSDQNLSERTPPRWIELLFHSHPAISKRITAAEAFARKPVVQ
jgi:Zn-dependent protease with chaperone function